ncbi:pyridoxine 5'-phosphate synthase [Tistrella bauzanensis]
MGLGIQAGHGLDFATLAPVAALPHLQGITCGRFLIAEALFIGIEDAVRHTRRLIDAARRQARRHAAQTGG